MRFAGRTLKRSVLLSLTALAGLLPIATLHAVEKPRIEAEDYTIEARVAPQSHKLTARAVVKFVALDDISIAIFELHNALRVTQVTDEQGTVLPAERVSQDSTVRVALPSGMSKGQEATLTFDYEGTCDLGGRQPGSGTETGLRGRSDHLSAVLRALVSGDQLRHRPLHRTAEDHRAAGVHGGCQRRARLAVEKHVQEAAKAGDESETPKLQDSRAAGKKGEARNVHLAKLQPAQSDAGMKTVQLHTGANRAFRGRW